LRASGWREMAIKRGKFAGERDSTAAAAAAAAMMRRNFRRTRRRTVSAPDASPPLNASRRARLIHA